MKPETVKKLITIQSASHLREIKLEGFRQELDKWTTEDAFVQLGADIQNSAAIVPLSFKNWVEDWEAYAICVKNDANGQKLLQKYKLLYLHDPDMEMEEPAETRRIVDIEWTKGTGEGSVRVAVHYSLVTQHTLDIDAEFLESYLINDELH